MPRSKFCQPLALLALTGAAFVPPAQAQTSNASQAVGLSVSADVGRRADGRAGLAFGPSAGLSYHLALPGLGGELRILGQLGMVYSLDLDLLLPLSSGAYAGVGAGSWSTFYGEQGWAARTLLGVSTPPNRGLGAFGELAAQWAFNSGRCNARPTCLRQGLVPTVRFGTLYRF